MYLGVWYFTTFITLISMLRFDIQIHEEAKKFSYQTGVKVVVVYGGAPINQQVIIPFLLMSYLNVTS